MVSLVSLKASLPRRRNRSLNARLRLVGMVLARYPLISSAVGTSTDVEMIHVSPARAYDLPSPDVTGYLQKTPTGWKVMGPTGYLAAASEEVVHKYADLNRVFASGMFPEVQVKIRPLEDGSGNLRITVALPPAPFLVPHGKVGEAEVFTQGGTLELSLSEEFSRPCQVIAHLEATGNQIAATVDDRLIGGIANPPQVLLDLIRVKNCAARIFIAEGRAIADISPECITHPLVDLLDIEPAVVERRDQPTTVMLSLEEMGFND